MEIVSLCALPASGFEWQPQQGAFALTVVCKATYRLAPGRSVLVREQDPPVEWDEHWDDDGARSLRAASDLAPYKPWADVVLVGPAYAPAKVAVRSFRVRLVVGAIDKSLVVWCDRSRRASDGQIVLGSPITKIPLLWERAAGGPGTDNPVGMRPDAAPDASGRVAIANLQPPGVKLGERGESFSPVGLGPLSPRWPARVRALAAYGADSLSPRWQEEPLPADFDYSYFNVAPPDQRTRWIRPDQRIALENLHPEHSFLVTALPGIEPRAVVDRATGEREELALVADTLCFDTERGVCTVVWRGHIGLRHAGEPGQVSFWIDDVPRAEAPRPTDTPLPAEMAVTRADSTDATLTMLPRSVLPFAQGQAPAPPAGEGVGESTLTLTVSGPKAPPLPFRLPSTAEPVVIPKGPEPPPPQQQDDRITLVEIDVSPPAEPTPFVLPEPHRREVSPTTELQGEETISHNEPGQDPLLVFHLSGASPAAIAPERLAPPAPPAPAPTARTAPAPTARTAPAPTARTAPAPTARTATAPPARLEPPPAPPASEPPAPTAPTAPKAPAPSVPEAPPMLGPLGAIKGSSPAPKAPAPVPEAPPMLGPLGAIKGSSPAPAPPAPTAPKAPARLEPPPALLVPQASPPAAPPEAPVDSPFDPASFELERWAALTARLALHRPETARILEGEGLTAARWAEVDHHWNEAIQTEARRGKTELLRRSDAAYIAEVEKLRGPITANDYARMAVSAERGTRRETMADLGLPMGAAMRIERIWIDRLFKEPSLSEQTNEAMARARTEG